MPSANVDKFDKLFNINLIRKDNQWYPVVNSRLDKCV